MRICYTGKSQQTERMESYSGTSRAISVVADDGANPSPSPTRRREKHNARSPKLAAGGATSVPKDQRRTPAKRTRAPPNLHPPALPVLVKQRKRDKGDSDN